MRGKGLLLIGAIAGAIFASTPQGKKVIADVTDKAKGFWASPDVQKNVSKVQSQVRDVPYVGDTIADAIDKTKPAS